MNTYFVTEMNSEDELINFFDGLGIKWRIRPLEGGYSIIGAKMGIIDKVLYQLIFKETKRDLAWSRLRSV